MSLYDVDATMTEIANAELVIHNGKVVKHRYGREDCGTTLVTDGKVVWRPPPARDRFQYEHIAAAVLEEVKATGRPPAEILSLVCEEIAKHGRHYDGGQYEA